MTIALLFPATIKGTGNIDGYSNGKRNRKI